MEFSLALLKEVGAYDLMINDLFVLFPFNA